MRKDCFLAQHLQLTFRPFGLCVRFQGALSIDFSIIQNQGVDFNSPSTDEGNRLRRKTSKAIT